MTDNYEDTRKKLLGILKQINNPPVRGVRGGVLSGGVLSGGVLSGGDLIAASGRKRRTRRKLGGDHMMDDVTSHYAGPAAGRKHHKKGGIEAGMSAGMSAGKRKSHKLHSAHGAANPWIAHVKHYAATHNVPYRQALKMAAGSYRK